MKRIFTFLILGCLVSITSFATDRWGIYIAGTLSHDCGGYFDYNADGNTNFKWGGGALLGCGYEIGFANAWSITPALEFSYTDNGAYYNKTGKPAVNPFATDSKAQSVSHIWTSSWNIAIPVTAGYRIALSNNVRLRINAGVYFSEALAVRHFVNTGNSQNPVYEKRKVSSDFGNDFQIGTVGSFSVETAPHFSYFFRTQYPFLKDRWSTSTVTLALGVGYSF